MSIEKNTAMMILALAVILLAGGCTGVIDTGETLPVIEAIQGNLVVANESGEDLILFCDGVFLTRIPVYRSDLVVEVPVTGEQQEKELRIFRADEVSSPDEPEASRLFRSWNVVLTADVSLSDRRTWRILSATSSAPGTTGSLGFLYGPGSDYFVRVYIGGFSGSRIATLSSQAGKTVVGLDYGTYLLSYEYVYDDGLSTGATVIGTIDSEIVMGERVPIYVVLNAYRAELSMQIPHFENTGVDGSSPYASIRVENDTAEPLVIRMDGSLIEELIYLGDGSKSSASVIAAGDTADFIVPAGFHSLEAGDLSGRIVEQTSCDLPEDNMVNWTVS